MILLPSAAQRDRELPRQPPTAEAHLLRHSSPDDASAGGAYHIVRPPGDRVESGPPAVYRSGFQVFRDRADRPLKLDAIWCDNALKAGTSPMAEHKVTILERHDLTTSEESTLKIACTIITGARRAAMMG
jgi:hypothetical protein